MHVENNVYHDNEYCTLTIPSWNALYLQRLESYRYEKGKNKAAELLYLTQGVNLGPSGLEDDTLYPDSPTLLPHPPVFGL